MENYLYGFTIHSIQGYIFQTNKLKEIAGASELVEQICTTEFAKMIDKDFKGFKDDPCAIRNAAGNIRYLFSEDQLNLCKEVVKVFPKKILEFAPGVQISQAVVEISENDQFHLKSEELERKLTAQRNNPFRPVDLGYMAINRSRRTGLPSCDKKDDDKKPLDKATYLKQKQERKSSRVSELFFGSYFDKERITADVEKIVSSKDTNYSWLAVIHADGNNMGKALQNLKDEITIGHNYADLEKRFSEAVDEATKVAANTAFVESMKVIKLKETDKIPFRPIIVGGDDLTIVCRADLALNFTKVYLEIFKKQTEINFCREGFTTDLKNGLTACAGIAYIKVNYPFHYAVDLAEKLCSHAKKDAKSKVKANGLVPSCLMFHKVQDSFVESYEDIIKRELTAHAADYKFDFGPYYLDPKTNKPTIKQFLDNVSQFNGKEGNAIKSGLRQWLTDLHDNKGMAEQRMKRLVSVGNDTILNNLGLKENKGVVEEKSPVYDWLTVLSINLNDD
ncbi:MAG: CRISPR-associated protein [Bacteroidetes bacterium]|nr:CRISPR-associated protein [Bacteroidota bacterium]MCL6101938.1 CRISPR-associated protein [Bacteroidota bacterium]